ncbi:MAG: DedA family protein [Candidatus Niyogibacteria bacterium]|nr:DedA family protein [Candidatus Niyogibacteria bacterium]
MVSRLYTWTIRWAHTKCAAWALAAISFAESSFFPIPPDPVLMIMTLLRPAYWWRYALLTTATSAAGGVAGYFIGLGFYEFIGKAIIETYHLTDAMVAVGARYQENAFLAIVAAALTPIPYKVFTIGGGLFEISLWTLIVASLVGRGIRFFGVALLMFIFGSRAEEFIKQHFNDLTVAFFILIALGFVAIKFFF